MGRQRDPNRDKAKEIYMDSGGEIRLSDIASQLGVSEGTVRGWKSKDKWRPPVKPVPKVTIKEKMHALNRLAMHMGMIGPLREICKEEVEINKPLVRLTIRQYLRDDINIWQKQACAFIMDYYIPEWRSIIPAEYLGPIVDRNSKECKDWRSAVLLRDNHNCVGCGSSEDLEAHHILPWAKFPDMRIVIDNGVTLCNVCHAKEHEDEGLHHLIQARVNKTNNTTHKLTVGWVG